MVRVRGTLDGPLEVTASLAAEALPEALERATIATAHASSATQRARELVDESRRLRADSAANGSPRFFVVHGEVEQTRVHASWFRGKLLGTPLLLDRGEILVKLGERFENESGGIAVDADLGTPLAAMLTLVRACDRVVSVRFGPYFPGMGPNTVEVDL